MDDRPDDLDATRRAVADRGLTAEASGHLTSEVAMALPFEALAPFKTAIKRFFSTQPWTEDDADELSELVAPHLDSGWWEHDLDDELRLAHGIRGDGYRLWVGGAGTVEPSVFDRAFAGPVVPEPTPHLRKVKFNTGGDPSPGAWHLREEGPHTDRRLARLFDEPDVTDVMVAGDFVTVGIDRTSSWEERLDPILDLVTELFAGEAPPAGTVRTRQELIAEGRATPSTRSGTELHLLDPDDPGDRRTLLGALDGDDARRRRTAVAILAESSDGEIRQEALRRGATDRSRVVRRTAVDTAADATDETLRDLFERCLDDEDAWVRWKAVRSLGELGTGPSREPLTALGDDPDFQVRFEVARVLRSGPGGAPTGG